jgi:cytochrome b561
MHPWLNEPQLLTRGIRPQQFVLTLGALMSALVRETLSILPVYNARVALVFRTPLPDIEASNKKSSKQPARLGHVAAFSTVELMPLYGNGPIRP